MANTPKKGLDYFPLEVGYFTDPKTELISAEFGTDGEYLFLRLLSIIYSDEGYYCEWNKDKALVLAKKCGFSLEKIELILARLVERSMFDEQLFHSAKVLTSRKIQKVYIKACVERQSINVIADYYLLSGNDEKELPDKAFNKLALISKKPVVNKIKPVFNSIKPPINSQSKVKESKEKYSTVTNVEIAPTDVLEKMQQRQQIIEYFTNNIQAMPAVLIIEKLCSWLDTFSADVIVKAFDEAISANKRSYKYVEGILKAWEEKKLFTLSLVEGHLKDWEDKKKCIGKTNQEKPNRFVNFKQREWDYAAIEKAEQEYLKRCIEP